MFSAILSNPPTLLPAFLTGESSRRIRSNAASQDTSPRELGVWSGDVNEQRQCGFLLKLPAEIRNAIYEYVFTPEYKCTSVYSEWRKQQKVKETRITKEEEDGDLGVRAGADVGSNKKETNENTTKQNANEKDSTPTDTGHALDLLLTCRKINEEATILAFTLHPFLTNACSTFYALRKRTSILPKPCFAAIRALSFTIDVKVHSSTPCNSVASDFICNALLLSRTITDLEVRVKTYPGAQGAFKAGNGVQYSCGTVNSCRFHLANWFLEALGIMLNGRSYVWQQGEKWDLSWPYLHAHRDDPIWSDARKRKQMCTGDCVSVLEQEGTGRRVQVRLVYDWGGYAVEEYERAGLKVTLVSGAVDKLPVETVNGNTGFVYEPSQEYWDDLRKRKGKQPLGVNGSVGEAAEGSWKGSLARVLLGRK